MVPISGGRGWVPLFWLKVPLIWLEGTPILAGGGYPILAGGYSYPWQGRGLSLSWLGYPKGWTWDRTLNRVSDRTREYPLPLQKGPVTRGWGISPLPVNRQTPVKTLPSRILRNAGGNKSLFKNKLKSSLSCFPTPLLLSTTPAPNFILFLYYESQFPMVAEPY